MKEILEYINILKKIDTEGVEPLVDIHDGIHLRDDVIIQTDIGETALQGAPETAGNMYVTPLSI